MAKKRGMDIVVIVEDQQLARFVRLTLKEFGFEDRYMRIRRDYPQEGSGSGKHYVEQKYQEEVVTFRQKQRENRALLLASEADEQSVQDRKRTLDEQLSRIKAPLRAQDDRIVYWIPKWHVETWGLHLKGSEVKENIQCKHRAKNVVWRQVAKQFVEEYRKSKHTEIKTLDSLKEAYVETGRLGL